MIFESFVYEFDEMRGLNIMRVNRKDKTNVLKQKFSWKLMWKQRYLLCMSVPFVIWLIIFKYLPLWGWTMAFQDVKPKSFAVSIWEREFVGFDNFMKAFTDGMFVKTIINTMGTSFLGLVLGTVSAIFLKADGKFGKTYSGLPMTRDESVKNPSLAYPGLITGQGVGISSTCKDPVAAIKFLDFICSDEGQVLTHWGIKDVNYFIDVEGHRYRTEEEVNKSNTDTEYGRTSGVGFHIYPFPTYGDGVEDSTGSTYSTVSKDAIIAEYNEEQKAACNAWGVDLLVDVFPQASEFEVPAYSPIWAYAKPAEFNEISTKLDEISWAGLIRAVIGKESDFDSNYDAMVKDLEDGGMYEAEKMLSDIVKAKVALVKE